MHGHGWFCIDTCSLDPEKQFSKKRIEQKEAYLKPKWQVLVFVAFRMIHLQPVVALAGVGVGLRVVVMVGCRHGAGALPVCGGSILFIVSLLPLLVISLSSPCCFPIVTYCCLSIVPHHCLSVIPSFFLRLLAPMNHPMSSSSQGWGWVLGLLWT